MVVCCCFDTTLQLIMLPNHRQGRERNGNRIMQSVEKGGKGMRMRGCRSVCNSTALLPLVVSHTYIYNTAIQLYWQLNFIDMTFKDHCVLELSRERERSGIPADISHCSVLT